MNRVALLAGAAVLAVAVAAVVWAASSGDSPPPSQAGMGEEMGGMDMSGTDTNEQEMPGSSDAGAVASLPETPLARVTQMDGLVMPPGIVVTADESMEAMAAMAAVDLTKIAYSAPPGARGDRPLEPRVIGGVKEFRLEASLIRWNILPDVQVAAYAFNRQVPGPRIRVREGDRVRIVVENELPEATSVHWHGLTLPNAMDGASEVTQEPIAPGETYTYEFTARDAGTFFYHSHQQADRQQSLGLYGALVVDPKASGPAYDEEVVVQLQEWTFEEGYTFPSMPQDGLFPNYFTINGKAYPATEKIRVKQGEKVLFRFIGSSSGFSHPMHLHGGPFTVVATDGNPVPAGARLVKDTISVAPGERYDVVWTARDKGTWLLHCHVLHHTTNDDLEEAGGGGLTMAIEVT